MVSSHAACDTIFKKDANVKEQKNQQFQKKKPIGVRF